MAQLQLNPQAGFVFTSYINPPPNTQASANLGWTLGADLRMGERFYFQPGLFFLNSATTIKPANIDTALVTAIRQSFRLKALAGFNLVDAQWFKLRLNGGPSLDYIYNLRFDENNVGLDDNRYNRTILNLQAGLGFDVWILSGELGYNYGISRVYKNDDSLIFNDARAQYAGIYFTVGIVLGKNKRD